MNQCNTKVQKELIVEAKNRRNGSLHDKYHFPGALKKWLIFTFCNLVENVARRDNRKIRFQIYHNEKENRELLYVLERERKRAFNKAVNL